MRSRNALLLLLLCPLACAHGTTVEKLELDTYRITCADVPLDRCLAGSVSNVCDRRAYFVVRGLSDINNRGRSEAPDTLLSSQAIVRCGPVSGWGEQGEALMSAAPIKAAAPVPTPVAPKPAAVAPAPAPAPVCASGATQACVGPAGCTGGQACKADGSGYEPCDCGPATAPVGAP